MANAFKNIMTLVESLIGGIALAASSYYVAGILSFPNPAWIAAIAFALGIGYNWGKEGV